MPEAVACGMALLALESGRPNILFLFILMFARMLRTREAFTVQFWQAEPLEVGATIDLHLPNTKTSRRKHRLEQTVMHIVFCVILRLLARRARQFSDR